jgi:hypothetical protein
MKCGHGNEDGTCAHIAEKHPATSLMRPSALSVPNRALRLGTTKSETMICKSCEKPFEPEPRVTKRLGHEQKVCAACALAAIFDACSESVMTMTDEEIEAELREDGVDVATFTARMREVLQEAMRRSIERSRIGTPRKGR